MEENKKETKPVEEKKAEEKKVERVKTAPKKEEKKENNTNHKNNNGLMLGIAVAVMVVLVIAVTIMLLGNSNSPKAVLENEFKNLKAGTFMQEMVPNLLQGQDGDTEMAKLLYEKLEWKILKETQEGETATVEVEITNKNFKTIMEKLMKKTQQAVKSALTGNITEETITNWLLEELRNEEAEMTTTNANVTLKKENDEWKIENEEDFYYITLPGLQEAMNAIQ